MDYKKLLAGALVFSMMAAAASCDDKNSGSSDSASDSVSASVPDDASKAEAAEEDTKELVPPSPVEADDVNAVTFDDGNFSFAAVVEHDDSDNSDAAVGELSVVEVQGNKMLKFTDDGSVPLDDRVQKIRINAAELLGVENLEKVNSIEFDLYADATSDLFVNDNGENVKVPGWIGGGGGTVTAADDKWYQFTEFSGGEYDFEMSGAVHAEFKFLLAAGGQKWSADMEDANFLIMRWGMKNESNLYIDNIVFYDEDGNSIPIAKN